MLRIEPEVSSTYGTAWSGRFGKQHLTDGKKQHTSASAFYIARIGRIPENYCREICSMVFDDDTLGQGSFGT